MKEQFNSKANTYEGQMDKKLKKIETDCDMGFLKYCYAEKFSKLVKR